MRESLDQLRIRMKQHRESAKLSNFHPDEYPHIAVELEAMEYLFKVMDMFDEEHPIGSASKNYDRDEYRYIDAGTRAHKSWSPFTDQLKG